MSGPLKIEKGISLTNTQRPRGGGIPKAYDKKMREVAKLYETQFLREMHKAMKGTIQKSGFIKEGMAEKIFQEKLDNQYIDDWAGQGGIGLSNIIYQQLRERVLRATNGFVPKPQGPLPLEKGTVLKIDNSISDEPNRVPGLKGVDNGGDVSFILEAPTRPGEPGIDVSSPWSGVVKQVAQVGDGEQVVRIEHENKLFSLIGFRGSSTLKEGEQLQAGQKLGTILSQPQRIRWKVSDSVQSKG